MTFEYVCGHRGFLFIFSVFLWVFKNSLEHFGLEKALSSVLVEVLTQAMQANKAFLQTNMCF